MIKNFPGTLGELSLLFLLSFDPLPTRLPLPSPHSCVQSRQGWCSPVLCKNGFAPRNTAARRNRPGASGRKVPHCVHSRPRRRHQASGRVPRASIAPHPALHIPLSVSGAGRARAFRTALRAALREPHPRTPHSAAQPTTRTLHRTPRSRHPAQPSALPLSAPPPLSACHRRTAPGASRRPRTGFPRGSSVLSRLSAYSAPFPAPGRATAARPAPPSGGARGVPPGWASRLSPSNSATIAHHRCASPLKGAPYCSPLYLAIYYFLSLPRLIRTPASVCCGGIPAQPGCGSPRSLAPSSERP